VPRGGRRIFAGSGGWTGAAATIGRGRWRRAVRRRRSVERVQVGGVGGDLGGPQRARRRGTPEIARRRLHGHADANASAAARLRVNRQLAADERRALTHAEQAETVVIPVRRIEADARIGDLQRQAVPAVLETNFGLVRLAVPRDVVERLL